MLRPKSTLILALAVTSLFMLMGGAPGGCGGENAWKAPTCPEGSTQVSERCEYTSCTMHGGWCDDGFLSNCGGAKHLRTCEEVKPDGTTERFNVVNESCTEECKVD